MELLPGVRARMVSSGCLRTHLLESGPDTGTPLVLVHGNLSTGRFFEHLMPDLAGAGYRVLAPDMRSFGRSEAAPIDATRGLDDWADDIAALLAALGIAASAHLVGWSTGGAAIARFAQLHRVASLTLIDPVSPFGYGGVRDDGSLIHHDAAGSGAAGVAAEFVQRLRDHDTSADSPLSPRSFLREAYWSPHHRLSPDREDLLVEEILMSALGNGGYPGSARTSPNWPGFGPGDSGILNALSPKYLRWDGIIELDPKPPVLWVHGTDDVLVADGSMLETGTLGKTGAIEGWPGEEQFPPQRMVSQIRTVLDRYAAAGGRVQTELFEGSGHGPHIDAQDRFTAVLCRFLTSV
jgi:pimeloyl-ACP methyl ester carboxylesterase